MNHYSPSTATTSTISNQENRAYFVMNRQGVPPLAYDRRDLLLSSSSDLSASESSLDSTSPIKSYDSRLFKSDSAISTTRPDELRAYNISLARKLRRMKRRLLLENALVLAQGPTTPAVPVTPTNSETSYAVSSIEETTTTTTSSSPSTPVRTTMATTPSSPPPRPTKQQAISRIKEDEFEKDSLLSSHPAMGAVPDMMNRLTSYAA